MKATVKVPEKIRKKYMEILPGEFFSQENTIYLKIRANNCFSVDVIGSKTRKDIQHYHVLVHNPSGDDPTFGSMLYHEEFEILPPGYITIQS